MRQLLSVLRENFEYVILDSSPMGYFTDTEVLCDMADASLLVVRQDIMPDRAINDAIDSLSRCKASFLGYVFNDVHTMSIAARIVGGHRYGYGYGYGRGYGYGYGSSKALSHYGYGYGNSSKAKESIPASESGEDAARQKEEEAHGNEE